MAVGDVLVFTTEFVHSGAALLHTLIVSVLRISVVSRSALHGQYMHMFQIQVQVLA